MFGISASPVTPISPSNQTPGPLPCRNGDFHYSFDHTGLNGTVCAVSIPPARFDITRCCHGTVGVLHNCTQWCKSASQQGDLSLDTFDFSDCLQEGNDGDFIYSMCGEYRDGKMIDANGNDTNSSGEDDDDDDDDDDSGDGDDGDGMRPKTNTGARSTLRSALGTGAAGGLVVYLAFIARLL